MNYWEYIGSSSARGQVGEKGGFNIIPLQETSEVCIFCWDTNALKILLLIFFFKLIAFFIFNRQFVSQNKWKKVIEASHFPRLLYNLLYTKALHSLTIYDTPLWQRTFQNFTHFAFFFLKCVISGNKPMHFELFFSKCVEFGTNLTHFKKKMF